MPIFKILRYFDLFCRTMSKTQKKLGKILVYSTLT